MARQQMSQRTLAARLDIDPALVSKRLRCDPGRTWTVDELDAIAVVLGVPVAQLLGPTVAASAA